jgi:cell wall-associated NlpC family hydrolase
MEKLRAGMMVWAVALVGTLGAMAGGCASTGGVPKPFPTPGGRPRAQAPTDGATITETGKSLPPDTYALVGTALDLRGVRYRNGGSDPGGFDCSGFTQYVFAQHGVRLPRSVKDQFDRGTAVRPEDVREGDLLFFSTDGPGASHVAIAVGGDSFVHAPSSSGVVRVERISSRYWASSFVGARRVP